jgi:hypothetical protein
MKTIWPPSCLPSSLVMIPTCDTTVYSISFGVASLMFHQVRPFKGCRLHRAAPSRSSAVTSLLFQNGRETFEWHESCYQG